MKHWRCEHCKRRIETEDDIIVYLCKCGEYFEEVGDGE